MKQDNYLQELIICINADDMNSNKSLHKLRNWPPKRPYILHRNLKLACLCSVEFPTVNTSLKSGIFDKIVAFTALDRWRWVAHLCHSPKTSDIYRNKFLHELTRRAHLNNQIFLISDLARWIWSLERLNKLMFTEHAISTVIFASIRLMAFSLLIYSF